MDKRKIEWFEILAGEKALTFYGDVQWLDFRRVLEYLQSRG